MIMIFYLCICTQNDYHYAVLLLRFLPFSCSFNSLLFFPMTVTPFPVLVRVLRASPFCFLIPPAVLTFANLSTLFSKESRAFLCFFFCLLRAARFCAGVSSLRARKSLEDGANISSGASIVEVDFVVGSADSMVVAATLEIVEMVALGCRDNSDDKKLK